MRRGSKLKWLMKCRPICDGFTKTSILLLTTLVLVATFGCERQKSSVSPTTYTLSAARLEKSFGSLVTVANIPTIDQNGTGDRLGIFLDEKGTYWGIPLTRDAGGIVLGCAPAVPDEIPVSDTLPADTDEVVGAANEPTNWRGGTGKIELLLRNKQGGLFWYSVKPVETKPDSVCRSQSEPVQPLPFYRLEISGEK